VENYKEIHKDWGGSTTTGEAEFKLSGRSERTKKSILLVQKSEKCQKTAILDQTRTKNELSDLATRKFELNLNQLTLALMVRLNRKLLASKNKLQTFLTLFTSVFFLTNYFWCTL